MGYLAKKGSMYGSVTAIGSKSLLHRLLIAAALGPEPVSLPLKTISRDLTATMACLSALGASFNRDGDIVTIVPGPVKSENVLLPCGDSGTTLRFLLPAAAALGVTAQFEISGMLGKRPMEPLLRALSGNGVTIREIPVLSCSGQLQGGDFRIPGDISSQFISGLLFALPLLKQDSRIILTTKPESTGYITMTLDVLHQAGISILPSENGYLVPGKQTYHLPSSLISEGDWSDGGVFLCAGAIAGQVTVQGLRSASLQGDRAIGALLRQMGADITYGEGSVTAAAPQSGLRPIQADLRNLPDLAPVLAAAAAAAKGVSRFTGCGRLRYKECNRLEALEKLICGLGGHAEATEDTLTVYGTGSLIGGKAETYGDHRIAMAAALCGLIAETPVEISGPECTEKSHPGFFRDFDSLRRRTLP